MRLNVTILQVLTSKILLGDFLAQLRHHGYTAAKELSRHENPWSGEQGSGKSLCVGYDEL